MLKPDLRPVHRYALYEKVSETKARLELSCEVRETVEKWFRRAETVEGVWFVVDVDLRQIMLASSNFTSKGFAYDDDTPVQPVKQRRKSK